MVTGDGVNCVLRTNGSVLCFGQIEDFTVAGPSGKLINVAPLQSISAEHGGFCGITRLGETVAWEVNLKRAKPVEGFDTDNVAVVAVEYGYCVLKRNREVRCQGRYTQVPPDEAPLVHTEASKLYNSVAVTDRGVEAWGSNKSGWLGTAVPLGRGNHPATVVQSLPGPVKEIAQATGVVCALNERGEVWCWGDGGWGGLGPEHSRFCAEKCPGVIETTPVRIPLPEPAKGLAGPTAFCALLESGSIWCWGTNTEGLVKSPRTVTHRVKGLVYFFEPTPQKNKSFGNDNVRIFGDLKNLCALKTDGSLWCAGDNTYSQIPSKPVDGKRPGYVPATRMNVTCD